MNPTPTVSDTAADLLEVVRDLARELQPQRRGLESLSLDASLERDLGLDSLGRVELFARLERRFGARLPESALTSAETPRDLLGSLQSLSGGEGVSRTATTARTIEVPDLADAEAAPDRTRTLMEVLAWHAERHPERRHILFYPGADDAEPEELTYGELDRRARAAAAGLVSLGLEPGGAVGLMLPSGLDYFIAFFGALLAGGVPVPLYPPVRRSQIEDHLRRQAGILKTSEAGFLITFSEVLPLARLLRGQVPELRRVITVDELRERGAAAGAGSTAGMAGIPVPRRSEDIAFLQFTSGSTGNPKGVVLTHANLLANLRAIGQGAEIRPGDAVVSWLPLYHDMGLIGAWMGSLYFGMPLNLMSPLTFLSRPSRWLWTLHRHRATLSAAPNFAYELCVQKIEDAEIEGLDLSSWRFALNGAEPVSPDVIRRFTERFAPYGFRAGALAPVYGLAENSLALAFPPPGRPPVIATLDRETFQRSGRAVPLEGAAEGDPRALRFPSCGFVLPGHDVRIVDAAGLELGERQEGRLEFRGPSATQGYYRNPEATARLVRGNGWVDSGDLAYLADGEVYITGRVKDVILRGGRNLYPQELEGAVGEIAGIRKGCVAVFGSPDPATGTERLVVLAETREDSADGRERLRGEIQARALDLLGSPADDVVLAPPHTVPKTSSGKIRRSASRELYESGQIGKRGSAFGWQLARLAGAGARAQAGRWLRAAGGLVYGLWFGLVFALAAPPVWIAMALLPGERRRRAFARRVGRTLAAVMGIRLTLEGAVDALRAHRPCLVAANHASYLDGFVLTALLPPDFAYVIKRELEGPWISRIFLRRLGTVFVERFDAAQSAGEARKLLEAVRGGESVAIFPEGTFRRTTGLRPFRLGAFTVAADAGAPVVPVTIRGTRSILRGGTFLPRRGAVTVTVAPPVSPPVFQEGEGWSAAVRLRDAVREEILARCGEPDLAS
jgi:1-acyl-sn-glycerol-3-phosphate acyltransferase